jgi:hypothetical protein
MGGCRVDGNLLQGLRIRELTVGAYYRREDDPMDYTGRLLEKYDQLVSIKIDLGRFWCNNWSSARCLTRSLLGGRFLLNFNMYVRALLRSSNDYNPNSGAGGRASKSTLLSGWPILLARVERITNRQRTVTHMTRQVEISILFRLLQGAAFLSRKMLSRVVMPIQSPGAPVFLLGRERYHYLQSDSFLHFLQVSSWFHCSTQQRSA